MTYIKARQVIARSRREFGVRCRMLKWGRNNYRVTTEEAFYFDKEKAHNHLFGKGQP